MHAFSRRNRAFRVAAVATAAFSSVALLVGCSSAPAEPAGGGDGGDSDKFVIGFQQPLGGQAWRETGLAALQALANQPEYVDKVEVCR